MRLNFIIVLRCIAVLFVIFGHSICMYTTKWGTVSSEICSLWQNVADIIYFFHMPIFTLIAGYVYMHVRKSGRYDSFPAFLKKKTMRILVPLAIWGIIECFVDLGGANLINLLNLISGPLHLWYLRFIFECFIITRLIDTWLIKKPYLILLIIIALSVLDLLPINIFKILGVKFTDLYRYFLLGLFFQLIIDNEKIKKYKLQINISTVVMLIGVIVLYFFQYKIALSLNVLVFNALLFLSYSCIAFTKIPSCIVNLDSCSMGIYILHHPIIWNLAKFETTRQILIEYKYIAPFIVTITVLVFCWVIVNYVNKNKHLRIIFG